VEGRETVSAERTVPATPPEPHACPACGYQPGDQAVRINYPAGADVRLLVEQYGHMITEWAARVREIIDRRLSMRIRPGHLDYKAGELQEIGQFEPLRPAWRRPRP